MITIENRIEHPGLEDAGLDEEAERIGGRLKEAARYRQRAMVQWYLDQLAEHFVAIDRADAKAEKETAVENEIAAEIKERRDRLP